MSTNVTATIGPAASEDIDDQIRTAAMFGSLLADRFSMVPDRLELQARYRGTKQDTPVDVPEAQGRFPA